MNKPMDLPAAEAAKLVKREEIELGKDGKPTGKVTEKPITAREVFANVVRGDAVTVVTVDGRKLHGTLPPPKAEKVTPPQGEK